MQVLTVLLCYIMLSLQCHNIPSVVFAPLSRCSCITLLLCGAHGLPSRLSSQLPEILRTPLEEVVLQIKLMHLAAPAHAAAASGGPPPTLLTPAGLAAPSSIAPAAVTLAAAVSEDDATTDEENEFSALKHAAHIIPSSGDDESSGMHSMRLAFAPGIYV